MKKKMRVLTLITALILVLTACGSSMSDVGFSTSMDKAESMNGGGYDYGMSYDTEEWVTDEIWVEEESGNASYGTGSSTDGSGGNGEILTGDKLVYTCDLTIQTLDYEECVETIKNNIATYNGIIERETESDDAYRWYYEDYVKKNGTRYLNLTIRIPSGSYYEFLDTLEGTGKIISKSSYVENISRQYYETGAMIESLEIQQDRLLDMMEQTTSIEDMITIEARLSEVQYQLSLYKNRLASMDADVEYSTITIRVEEVMEYIQEQPVVKTNTFFDRLWNTLVETWEFFLDMLEGLLFFVIRMIPIALVVGVIALIVRLIVRSHKKKKAAKIQNTQNMQNMTQIPPQQ